MAKPASKNNLICIWFAHSSERYTENIVPSTMNGGRYFGRIQFPFFFFIRIHCHAWLFCFVCFTLSHVGIIRGICHQRCSFRCFDSIAFDFFLSALFRFKTNTPFSSLCQMVKSFEWSDILCWCAAAIPVVAVLLFYLALLPSTMAMAFLIVWSQSECPLRPCISHLPLSIYPPILRICLFVRFLNRMSIDGNHNNWINYAHC